VASAEAFVATFVLNAAWQLPLLALLAAVAARGLRQASAAYRHAVWVAALALAVATPLRTALVARQTPDAAPAPVASLLYGATGARSDGSPGGSASPQLSSTVTVGGGVWTRPAAALYVLFVLYQAFRLGRSLIATRRLARRIGQGTTAPALVARLTEIAGQVGSERARARRRAIELRVSDEVAGPLTFATRPAVVVLPSRFVASASNADLRGALAHELAHVDRRDYRVNLLCEALFLTVAFHPAARLLRRRIAETREMACDEHAAAIVGARLFGRTLLSLAAAGSPRRAAHALGALDADVLEERMNRLLTYRRPTVSRASRILMSAAVVVLTAAGLLASHAGLAVAAPSDASLAGTWKSEMPEGAAKGKPAAKLTIKATAGAPEVSLILYRHAPGHGDAPRMERPNVVAPTIKDGVLRFRTRDEQWRPNADAPVQTLEADWEFRLVAKDEASIQVLRTSYAEALRARGEPVPPPPPPFKMTRVR
jgi:beta-lactamase regulating signal transducer with metallopeptidase domain